VFVLGEDLMLVIQPHCLTVIKITQIKMTSFLLCANLVIFIQTHWLTVTTAMKLRSSHDGVFILCENLMLSESTSKIMKKVFAHDLMDIHLVAGCPWSPSG
jgi:hypothetical protein